MDVKEFITADNAQKHENYREQFNRLKRALASEFYLEAIFIEYTIIEDRTESILRHAGMWDACVKKQRGRFLTIEKKIEYIKEIAREKKSIAHKYFSDTLMDEILQWKEERNRLIHALLKQTLTTEEVSEIAHTGERLTKEIRTRVTNFNRAVERKNKTKKGPTK
jgi:hypothetical protein